MAAAVSMVTMSPDSIVSAGLLAALKLPMFTVPGLGIRVYSAAPAAPGVNSPVAIAMAAESNARWYLAMSGFRSGT